MCELFWTHLESGKNGRFTNEEAYKMEIITYEIQSYHKSMACDIMRGEKKSTASILTLFMEPFSSLVYTYPCLHR